MATSLERLRSTSNLERLRATAQPAPEPAFSERHPWLTRALAGPTLDMAQDPAAGMEALGATGGAALGGMVGGLPGAMIGGGGLARVGRFAGNMLTGQEQTADMEMAGPLGAAGPLAGRIIQHAARLYSSLPTVKGAVEAATREARRRAAGSAASTIDQQLGQEQLKLNQLRSRFNGTNYTTSTGERIKLSEAGVKAANEKLADLEAMLRDPARAVERAQAKITAGRYTPGTPGAAFGALIGAGFGAFESAMTGGAIGFLMGRFRGHLAESWVQNPTFVRWASGLGDKTLPNAVATFITDVAPQNLPGTEELLGEMLDLTAATIAGSYVAGQTGSPTLGVGAGAVVNIGMDQVRSLANDALRQGERVWQELLGSVPAEGNPIGSMAIEETARRLGASSPPGVGAGASGHPSGELAPTLPGPRTEYDDPRAS
jgi:hypothetical protein